MVELITDCKGIESTVGKPLGEIKNHRLQRLFILLSNLSYTIKHVPGKQLKVVDCLSRAPLKSTSFIDEDEESHEEVSNIFLVTGVCEEVDDNDMIENVDLSILQDYIKKDDDYVKIMKAVKTEMSIVNLPNLHPAREWAGEWSKLSLLHDKGPLMYDHTRIVMPKGRQIDMVAELHMDTHGSAQRLQETLGGYCIWKGWKADIEAVCNKCIPCQELQPSQSQGKPRDDKIELTKLEPMDILHIDGFQYNGLDYISIRDQVSDFTWFDKLNKTDTQSILNKLNTFMGIFGKTKKIVTDNGPNLASMLMESYCHKKRISHHFSAPYNPTGNTISENGVKTCKWALRRSRLTGQNAHMLLRQRQSLWLSDCCASSQELFLKRRITPHHLNTDGVTRKLDWEKERESREKVRVARTERLIKNSKKIKNFKVGDFVVCQDILDRESKWTKKGRVVRVTNGKNSYVVELETGGEITRHRHHIRDDKTHENYRGNLGNISDVSGGVARSMSQENNEMGQTDIAHEIADDSSDEEMIN